MLFFETPYHKYSIKLTPQNVWPDVCILVALLLGHLGGIIIGPSFSSKERYFTWYQLDIAEARLEPWWRRSCSRCPARREPRKPIHESDRRSGARCRHSTSTWRQEQISAKKNTFDDYFRCANYRMSSKNILFKDVLYNSM